MNEKNIKLISYLKQKRILVFGDFMIDKYIYSEVDRISPEAPVPIAKMISEKSILGGAGNVVNNVLAFDSKTISLGVMGRDKDGEDLCQMLGAKKNNTNITLLDNLFKTIVKTRVVSGFYQLIRIDKEEITYVSSKIEKKILNKLLAVISSVDIVVIADYGKYVFSENFFKQFNSICKKNNIKILVDPAPQNSHKYTKAYLIKPNKIEAEKIASQKIKKDLSNVKDVCIQIKKILNVLCVVVTLGSDGMVILDEYNNFFKIKSCAKEVFDVSGAGDTVIAIMAICLANNIEMKTAAEIASSCASIVISKSGTSTCTKNELLKSYEKT